MKIFYPWQIFGLGKDKLLLTKIWKIMKLFTLFLFIATIQLSAKSYSQSINLTASNITLKNAFRQIEKQTDYSFFVDKALLKEGEKVSATLKNATIDEAMEAFLTTTTLDYQIIGKTVVLNKKEAIYITDADKGNKQIDQGETNIDVSGIVIDSAGAPIPGVTVYVKNDETNGTTTDLNGRYILTVSNDEAILIFRMIGFREQEIRVGDKSTIDVRLLPNTSKLEETVVLAFGEQKKKGEVIGAVTTIKPSELKTPSSNLTTALAGRLAGVIGYQRNGEPGEDDADYFIRGVTTFGYKKNPLILIDGVELTSTDLARMQVDDIESFSILKDATATALYGARGANGVILIETKQGKEGKAQVSLRMENSISMPTTEVALADPITFMELNNEAVKTRDPLGVTPFSMEKIDRTMSGVNPYAYPIVDWKKALFRKYTMNQRINLNVNGGGKVARYYLAATFNQDNGILKVERRNNFNNNINLKTYQIRGNIDVSLTKTTEVGVKLYGTFDDYIGPIGGGAYFYQEALRSPPTEFPAYYPVDSQYRYIQHILFGNTPDGYTNPYADMVRGYREYNRSLMLAQFNFKQDLSFLTKGLTLRGLFNTTRFSYFDVTRAYNPFYYQIGLYDKLKDNYTLSVINEDEGTEYLDYVEGPKDIQTTTYIQLITNYNRVINDKHSIGGMLIFLMQNELNGNAGSIQLSLPHRNIGVSGRFSYSFNDKYFSEFDFGYNGSERFYETNRFGFFPSIGLGWQISNERFWEPVKNIFSNLKLRGTYGLIGNDAIGAPDQRFFYLSDVNMDDGAKSAVFGIDNQYSRNGVSVNRYSNPEITWERSYKLNIGLDLGLFHNLDFSVDLWREKRTHILMPRSFIPTTMGLNSSSIPQANVGQAEGDGVDLSIDYSKFISNDFWLQFRANFTYAVSKFLVYEEPEYLETPWKSRVGYPLTQQWGYIAERLFVDEREVKNSPGQTFGNEVMGGDIKYRDVNRDGRITTLDQVPIGYPTSPEIVYGFGASIGYKKFDFSFFFQGLARESFWIDAVATAPFIISNANNGLSHYNQLLTSYAEDYWSEKNRNLYALWPRLSTSINVNNIQRSTWFMRNGAFLRLKNAEMAYSLPSHIVSKIRMNKMRIYINGNNLLLFSPFKLWDVEMAGNGLDYPVQKVFNVGVQISF